MQHVGVLTTAVESIIQYPPYLASYTGRPGLLWALLDHGFMEQIPKRRTSGTRPIARV